MHFENMYTPTIPHFLILCNCKHTCTGVMLVMNTLTIFTGGLFVNAVMGMVPTLLSVETI